MPWFGTARPSGFGDPFRALVSGVLPGRRGPLPRSAPPPTGGAAVLLGRPGGPAQSAAAPGAQIRCGAVKLPMHVLRGRVRRRGPPERRLPQQIDKGIARRTLFAL
ncbi:hypothetical protein GCM10009663_39480 [Kitasatospora arboriphila]|uniref:Uncharacterized protein n=1 Tax=Kitasatospora arboriphila TaxID=258052 RepID=A0ABN1TKI8_9ACTN